MEIGLIGLGKMGFNLGLNLMKHEHTVKAFDINEEAVKNFGEKGGQTFASIEALIEAMPTPRTIWLMVPDYMQVLREMNRVVKPGGMVVCLETSQSEIPVYRQLFRFYFNYIMPIFGKLFAKSFKEYSWLQESANDFPGMKKLAQMFKEADFQNVTYKPYSGGAAAMHMGFKKK